jgi:DNA-directed RNA polymerase specialized sigma24 family protein
MRAADARAPESTDVEGWEQIVAAIQDIGPCEKSGVVDALSQSLSERLYRILRRRVSVNHSNRGRDIVQETHDRIIESVFNPTTADGRALRVAFVPRVLYRMKNVIASEMRRSSRQAFSVHSARLCSPRPASELESCVEVEQRIDVESVLKEVIDDRQRSVFRMFMDGLPFNSATSHSITKSAGICENTARNWVENVRAQLAEIQAVR